MTSIFSYRWVIIILLLGSDSSANKYIRSYDNELYDGSQCTTEHGRPGICKKLLECPSRLADVLTGRRTGNAAGRCGFDGHIEIVCCRHKNKRKRRVRPAERVGSQCTTDQGTPGICKKLPECLPRLSDVLAGRRTGVAAGRCGFEGHIEIVCCPEELGKKLRVRPADIDGSQCTTEHGKPGICKKLAECRPMLNDVLAGRRTGNAADRCGFDGHMEIVCCPKELVEERRVRPADKDGHQCTTEQGKPGICKKLPECLPKLNDVQAGRRTGNAADRCGFEGRIEIVCCPMQLSLELRARPAVEACQKLQSNVTLDSDIVGRTSEVRSEGGSQFGVVADGTKADVGEFPYMAILGYGSDEDYRRNTLSYDCGGALITRKYVLTAAHCITNRENRAPRWVLMGLTFAQTSILMSISRTIPHPQYRRGHNYHDIALVEFEDTLNIPSFRPVCLQATPPSNVSVHSNISIIAIGIGAMGPNDDERSDHLMKSANLSLVPVTLCNQFYPNFANVPRGIDDTMVCAMDANLTRHSDTCKGDSGGPLLMITETAQTLIAVTSFGQICGTAVPSVYTSVLAYIDWIEAIVWPEKAEFSEIRFEGINPRRMVSPDRVSSLRSKRHPNYRPT